MAKTTVDGHDILSEKKLILNANSGHFLTLSVLFLPFTFASTAVLHSYFSSVAASDRLAAITNLLPIKTLITSPQSLFSLKTLILILAYLLFVIPGVAMITYSTNQAIYRKPLTFSSTVKSLSHSYIPLLSTTMAGMTQVTLVAILFTVAATGITEAVKLLGLHFVSSISVSTIASYALVITIVFFMVIWGLAAAIAVMESKLGFQTLGQSANRLSSGFRSSSILLVYVHGTFIGGSMIINSIIVPKTGSAMQWVWILQVFAIYSHILMMFSHYIVANTVLYVHCGGVIVEYEVDEEDKKVASEGSKAEANGGFVYMMLSFLIVGLSVGVTRSWE